MYRDPQFHQVTTLGRRQAERSVGRAQRHVGGVHAQEESLRVAVRSGTDDRDPLIGHLEAVADRAGADETLCKRGVMIGVVHAWTVVHDTGGKQDRAGRNGVVTHSGLKRSAMVLKPLDDGTPDVHAEPCCLLTHAVERPASGSA